MGVTGNRLGSASAGAVEEGISAEPVDEADGVAEEEAEGEALALVFSASTVEDPSSADGAPNAA